MNTRMKGFPEKPLKNFPPDLIPNSLSVLGFSGTGESWGKIVFVVTIQAKPKTANASQQLPPSFCGFPNGLKRRFPS